MNISAFDLNLLRVLDALLRDGSTVRAADSLGLSQPAVSAALGRLRHAFDDPLFVRRGQGMEPTDLAVELKPKLSRLLEEVSELINPQGFDPRSLTRAFRLAGSDFFAEVLMPPLAERLTSEAPKASVSLIDLLASNYVGNLERHEIDLALFPRMEMPEWVEMETVFVSGFVTIARAAHPRIRKAGIKPGGRLPIDLFCQLSHVLFSTEGRPSAVGDVALAKVGRKRHVAMTLPVFGAVCRAVAESDLIALVPIQMALKLSAVLGLEVYRQPIPVEPVDLVMVWPRRRTADPAHAWLRELIRSVLEPISRAEHAGRHRSPRPSRARRN